MNNDLLISCQFILKTVRLIKFIIYKCSGSSGRHFSLLMATNVSLPSRNKSKREKRTLLIWLYVKLNLFSEMPIKK